MHPAWTTASPVMRDGLRRFAACPPPSGWSEEAWEDAKRAAMNAAPATSELVDRLRPLVRDAIQGWQTERQERTAPREVAA